MLKIQDVTFLKNSKNLLAFSGGADSTSLFFLLLQNDIPFDIAIIDYALRAQSKEEVSYAQELALEHEKNCYVFTSESIEKNFEATARAVRYDFFEELIFEHGYNNLLTAHHLGDRLEWLLMQLSKGAGCAELNSMKRITKREGYDIIRPLLHVEKSELIAYLEAKEKKWFEDETNQDMSIKRNEFRHLYAAPLLKKYKDGILKSFEYIDNDTDELIENTEVLQVQELYYFKRTKNLKSDIYHIDKTLKQLGVMISSHTRDELKESDDTVVSRRYAVCRTDEYVFIAPYLLDVSMDKGFKERCRVLKIPSKLRPYLFLNQKVFDTIVAL
ncbi:tRNA lysidine(34) synthetase TilS [Sulfurimonas sp. HSL-1716]|uniref:tRNA lysidine(34) synthetase TilS n=1 Tax=Hydrocurvibacter sulfurireducens TaxID=3131937 RepID=UPI0031F8E39A